MKRISLDVRYTVLQSANIASGSFVFKDSYMKNSLKG